MKLHLLRHAKTNQVSPTGKDFDRELLPRGYEQIQELKLFLADNPIAPKTILGQLIASCMMIIGYAIIAVPTGMIGVEIIRKGKTTSDISTQACLACGRDGHDMDAQHCKHCGHAL